MDSVNSDDTAEETAWALLEQQVQAYLGACQVTNPIVRNKQAARIIAAAKDRYASDPRQDRTELVGEEIRRAVEEWAVRFIQLPFDESGRHRFAHVRTAVLLADLPRRWPDGFLNPDEQPAAFGTAFQGTFLQAGPELDFSSMVPRPIDLGAVSGLADGTWRTFDKWPILRGAVVWGLFLTLLALAFWVTRY